MVGEGPLSQTRRRANEVRPHAAGARRGHEAFGTGRSWGGRGGRGGRGRGGRGALRGGGGGGGRWGGGRGGGGGVGGGGGGGGVRRRQPRARLGCKHRADRGRADRRGWAEGGSR